MIDIKLVRENPKLLEQNIKKRKEPEKIKLLEEVRRADEKWRKSIFKLEQLKKKRNQFTGEIARLKKEKKPFISKISEMKKVSKEILVLEKETNDLKEKVRSILMILPNILHDSVPYGKDEKDNVEIKKVGTKPKFDFTPKNHLEIAEGLNIIDIERAAKVSGQRFLYLKNELDLLDMAIQRFAVELLMKKGYTLIEPPLMMKRKPYEGVTSLDDFGDVLYKVEGEDLHMIATSEHPMAAMFMNEVLNAKDLPIKLVGLSPCFRKEVGAHGKYTKGLFRMHNFNKVEQFIFSHPDESWKYHEELQKNAETLYQKLGLHYRVVNVCTGDIGTIAAKKYDTEIWMADGSFREIGSNSNCTDYQARRLNIRYRMGEGQAVAGFVHTLNNTALATSRTMMAILEQYQQKDGSVKVPRVLVPYMGGIRKIEKR